ncbi:5-formyltetrahydrofolate cyclo-ligase [Aureimonas leprariae]|uniref:5-formyltetrahydrofolate cyclo-ligase n=1 Tax=Plantimonas leprariae TaxID=2615207 RepID=A0A7V7PM85_9HYPH|nr:5-formyltetrahydrofolate cyclo-ligase [Aureimonas leprariae]KAB0678005.1 5-formyltetrahydrofolate cyclo-ligase [Aureimonas leprariae]
MSGSSDEKARLRGEALARRDAMPETARIEASLEVAERVVDELSFDPSAVVSGFLPIRSEIDPRPLMAALADRGARICVPAIVEDRLEFRELVRGAPLVPQGFGTYAPGEGTAVLRPTLMLVPLAAFDRRCHRIGYGRGYYDRAIAALRPLATVGLAFACLEVAAVPDEPHDVALDFVVTESAIHRSA